MTLRELQTRAAYWQDRLNLREWKITVRWGRAQDCRSVKGYCWWHPEEQLGEVVISKSAKDKEATLVHELLHLVLQGHEPLTGPYDIHLEKSINKIAAALTQ